MACYRRCPVCAFDNISERRTCKRCGTVLLTDDCVVGDFGTLSQRLVRLAVVASATFITAILLAALYWLFFDPNRPPIGDPILIDKEITVRNSASVPLLISDGSGIWTTPPTSRILPGETGAVSIILYPPSARREKAATGEMFRCCIVAETEALQRVLHECRATEPSRDTTEIWDVAPHIP